MNDALPRKTRASSDSVCDCGGGEGRRFTYFLLSSLFILLFVPIQYIDGIPIKSYNGEDCGDVIRSFAHSEFTAVKAIRIMPKSSHYLGYYNPPGIIDLYGNCDRDTLIHELAHHKQWLDGATGTEIFHHIGFDRYLQ